jgi:hypothetical protein
MSFTVFITCLPPYRFLELLISKKENINKVYKQRLCDASLISYKS